MFGKSLITPLLGALMASSGLQAKDPFEALSYPRLQLEGVPENYSVPSYSFKAVATIENPSQETQAGGGRDAYLSQEIPLSKVPQETLKACSWLIDQKFFSSPGPGKYGDRFFDVTKENAKSHIYFQLKFLRPLKQTGTSHARLEHPDTAWVLVLTAEGVHGGKEAMLATYSIDAAGKVLPAQKIESPVQHTQTKP